MKMRHRSAVALLAVVVGLAGCAGVQKPSETGFLSDYSNLEELSEGHLFYSAAKSANYTKFIIDPVVLLFTPNEVDSPFTQDELLVLQEYFRDEVVGQLSRDDGYEIVASPGPRVARIRMGITDVKRTIGALNVTIYTKVTGAGIGGASAEGEMLDSISGEQLAASIRWGGGSRLLRAGFTEMGDAKLAMDRWARDLRVQMDEAHDRR
jgi:hypothetical protein